MNKNIIPINKLKFFNINGCPHNIKTIYNVMFSVDLAGPDQSVPLGYISLVRDKSNNITELEFNILEEGDNVILSNIKSITITNLNIQKTRIFKADPFTIENYETTYITASNEERISKRLKSVKLDNKELLEYIIKNLELDNIISSVNFTGHIFMEKVSTGLIQTETIFVMEEIIDDEGNIDYIRPRIPEDMFLMFAAKSDEINFVEADFAKHELVKSKSVMLDGNLDNATDKTPLSVTVSFESDEEGVHVCPIGIYSVRKVVGKRKSSYIEPKTNYEYFTFGKLNLEIEAIGEDERYRTIFTNLGIPDPKEYHHVYNNIDILEDGVDNIKLNQQSKDMFLRYTEIFPYVGTYKALINAVDTLGYNDIYFREWYKSMDSDKQNKYMSFIAIDEDRNIKSLSDKKSSINVSLEDFLSMKKLNRLSMAYKINKLKEPYEEDEFEVPIVISDIAMLNETVTKLYALREWLQKYVVGANCRITDITGEGIYFDYYKHVQYPVGYKTYGAIQEHSLTPSFVDKNNAQTTSFEMNCKDLTAELNMSLVEYDNYTFDDFGDTSYKDTIKYVYDLEPVSDKNGNLMVDKNNNIIDNGIKCNDKWDADNLYHIGVSFPFDMPTIFDSLTYSVRNTTKCGTIIKAIKPLVTHKKFEDDYTLNYLNTNTVIGEEGHEALAIPNPILVNDNEIKLYHNTDKAEFKYEKRPTIKIENGYIRNINVPVTQSILYEIELIWNEEINNYCYRLLNAKTKEVKYSYDYIYLVPNENSSIEYRYTPEYDIEMFIIKNYSVLTKFTDGSVEHIDLFDKDESYILDINNGQIDIRYNNNYKEEIDIVFGDNNYREINITYIYTSENVEPYTLHLTDADSTEFNKHINDAIKTERALKAKMKETVSTLQRNINAIKNNTYILKTKKPEYEIVLFLQRDNYITSVKEQLSINSKNLWDNLTNFIDNKLERNRVTTIEVNHIGEYKGEVKAFDSYNNIYQKTTKRTASVYKDNADIIVGTPYNHSNSPEDLENNTKGLPITEIYDYNKFSPKDIKDKTLINNKEYLNYLNYTNFLHKEYTHLDNLRPIFPRKHRRNDIKVIKDMDKYKLAYPNSLYNILEVKNNDYMLLSNITENVVDIIINTEDDDEANITFYMNTVNPQAHEVYMQGNKLNLYIFDSNKLNVIGCLYNMNVIGYNAASEYTEDIHFRENIKSRPFVTCNYIKSINDNFNIVKYVNENKDNNIKLYLSNVSEYEILSYENNPEDRSVEVKIKVPITTIRNPKRFEIGQNIKLRSRQIEKLGKDVWYKDYGYDEETNVKVINDNGINVRSEFYYGDLVYKVIGYETDKNIHTVKLRGIFDESRFNMKTVTTRTNTGELDSAGKPIYEYEYDYSFRNLTHDDEPKIKLWLTYPNQDFVSYVVRADGNSISEYETNYVDIDRDSLTLDYIDNTYSMVVNNFNTEDAYNDWLYEIDLINPMLKYYYVPVIVRQGNQVHITSKNRCCSEDKCSVGPYYKSIWNIYNEDNLMYTLLNNSIFIGMNNKGYVSTELTTIDEYGNKVTTNDKSRIKIIDV